MLRFPARIGWKIRCLPNERKLQGFFVTDEMLIQILENEAHLFWVLVCLLVRKSHATHESLEMEIPYQSFKFSLLSWEMDLLENTCKRDNGRKSAMLEAQEVKQARAPHSTENFLSYRTSSHQILSHPVKVSFIGQLWRPTPSSKAIWTWFYEIWHKIISLDLSCYFDPKIQHNLYCSATTDLIHFLRWFESIEN